MLVLNITIDLGPGATPVQIEALVKAVRVATDVGREAELRRLRRAASEQLKFPTDGEMRAAIERFPKDAEAAGNQPSLSYRARRFMRWRHKLDADRRSLSPDMWWEYWARWGGTKKDPGEGPRDYERAFLGSPGPWAPSTSAGLDILDPDLYHAMVSDQIARLAPAEIFVRDVRYRNPFGEELAAIGPATAALGKAAGVVETAATLGSRRKIKKAEAAVAEATVDDRIAESGLGRELKAEQLRQARIANEIAEQELLAKRLENVRALDALNAQRGQLALVQQYIAAGRLDEADAIAALDPTDAIALVEFARRRVLQVEQRTEPDPGDDC